MLYKLKAHVLSLHRSARPRFDRKFDRARAWFDRDRLDVIRHRVARRFDQRRLLLVVATALAGLVMGSVTAAAATGGGPTTAADPAAATAEDPALLERQAAAERTERNARGGGDPTQDAQAQDAEAQRAEAQEAEAARATAADASPTPEPEPEETSEPAPPPPPPPDWVHPMPDARTTSCFGPRWGVMHAGVDLAAPQGSPIHAVGAGTVTHAGWAFGGYGISVVIDHHDGHYTHYAHALEAKVSAGDKVKPGDVIALEGSTGDSTGPHLHFEVHKGSLWNQVEPTRWMSNRGVNIGGC